METTLKDYLETRRGSRRAYYEFETFVLRLLAEHFAANGQQFVTGDELPHTSIRERNEIDAVVPDGVDDLPASTLVEIKLTRHPQMLARLLDRIVDGAGRADCNSILLVVGAEISTKASDYLLTRFRKLAPSIPVQIWGVDKLDEIFDEHRAVLAPLLENLTTLRLRTVVEKPSIDWKTERDQRLGDLASEYNDGNLALVLGAGVSIDAGLPSWETLLDSLFVRLLTRELTKNADIRDEEIESIVKRLKDVDDPSPLMTARYLRRGLAAVPSKEQDGFHAAVRNVLYAPKKKALSNSWVKALGKMVHPRRTGAKVRAVVTFNFDDLLEKELSASGDSFRSIFREGDTATNEELPIFHVHGFLPENMDDYDHLDDSTLVFSEEEYHEIYVDSYHWSNLVQLNLLRDSTCLFIGLSLTDPNLRRLLEISARRATNFRHFAFMQRMGEEEFTMVKGKSVVSARKKSTRQFLDSHHRIKEELFKELGITIIWFEEYKEVPKLLARAQNQIG